MADPVLTASADLEAGHPSAQPADFEVALESLNQWQLAWRRFKRHRMALIGLGIFAFMVVMAIVGPFILPYDPTNIPGAHVPGDVGVDEGTPGRERELGDHVLDARRI